MTLEKEHRYVKNLFPLRPYRTSTVVVIETGNARFLRDCAREGRRRGTSESLDEDSSNQKSFLILDGR